MNGAPVLAALVLLLVLLLVAQRQAIRRREQRGIPSGDLVYQDTAARLDKTLYSRRYHLTGRPDHVFWDGRFYIPVEVKTGRTPQSPYWSQIMQVIAYCALVEENTGIRPPYGVILFEESGKSFEIDFTRDYEQVLADTLNAMRQQRSRSEAHRSHQNPRVCASCGFFDRCDERLL
ncbi:MAG TPA: Dna2/Cas4 domain-containing protein [Aggregatilinea sp.]|uniref:CRISPR-associated protein Cas4 n=1 Tax=Aggregatilinea sp. TaxID=2806333 RepID=UPI002CE571BF|nr:Dna2/Cas4 domain-containing protein [Aggregatilinea sp.]HML21622.1 Dna2/Cas4 domain-containing protein [Aggregatilinea sp.]